jgi:hypothetical protein
VSTIALNHDMYINERLSISSKGVTSVVIVPKVVLLAVALMAP